MSDFDQNPFADPEATNPFADPSVTQARQTPGVGGLDDFNPFEDSNRATKGGPPPQPAVPAPQPAVMQPTAEPPPYSPPAYNAGAAQAGTDDLKQRQEELERKAAELARKEQELQRNMDFNTRKNNFPPLPQKCCVQPCFYQDFELDIPLEFQRLVKTLYYSWIAYVCILVLNVLGALAYFITAEGGSTGPGTTFGVSILYLVLFTPCSFICWYRPVYKAFRSDSSFNFFVFFFIFFFQFVWTIIMALGISGWGSCGIINGLQMVSVGGPGPVIMGLVMLFVGVMFALISLLQIILLIKVHRIYRSTGASFAKAQEEFAHGVMSNKTVQNSAANVGSQAVRGAMSGGSADNRY